MNVSSLNPSFKYTAIRTHKTDKKIYIDRIISSINLDEDVKLFKEILLLFIEETHLFKYKNSNKWFSYEPYKKYFNNDNEKKVKDWLDNLFKISKHRNSKLFFGKVFDTKSLSELKILFKDTPLNLDYNKFKNFTYISKKQLESLQLSNKWLSA